MKVRAAGEPYSVRNEPVNNSQAVHKPLGPRDTSQCGPSAPYSQACQAAFAGVRVVVPVRDFSPTSPVPSESLSLTSPVYVLLTLLASPEMEVKNIPSNGFIEQSLRLPLFSFYLADGECFSTARGKTLC